MVTMTAKEVVRALEDWRSEDNNMYNELHTRLEWLQANNRAAYTAACGLLEELKFGSQEELREFLDYDGGSGALELLAYLHCRRA